MVDHSVMFLVHRRTRLARLCALNKSLHRFSFHSKFTNWFSIARVLAKRTRSLKGLFSRAIFWLARSFNHWYVFLPGHLKPQSEARLGTALGEAWNSTLPKCGPCIEHVVFPTGLLVWLVQSMSNSSLSLGAN